MSSKEPAPCAGSICLYWDMAYYSVYMEPELQTIQERNKRVELDKAWETSKTRRTIIVIFTYVVAASFLSVIGNPSPQINALVPVGGYFLSTLSLPIIKKWWASKYGN